MFANLNFIPHIEEYVIVKKINKGCSGDEKYQLEKEGRFYLLRVQMQQSNIKNFNILDYMWIQMLIHIDL